MAWTSMHFATGMICGGAVAGVAFLSMRRGWRWLPLAMTVGGLWGLAPDLPRIFREDFPSLPFSSILGNHNFERFLHSVGDLFAFHEHLDRQPQEWALHGLGLILLLYNASIVLLMYMEHRQRRNPLHRVWLAHQPYLPKPAKIEPSQPPTEPPAPLSPDVLHRIGPGNASRTG